VLRVCVPMPRIGFECGFRPSDAANAQRCRSRRLPDSAARNSWNGTRNVYPNVPRTTSPASSRMGTSSLVKWRYRWDLEMTGFLRFSSGFGEKQEKRAQWHSKSFEYPICRFSRQTGSNPQVFLAQENEKILIVCLSSSRRGLHIRQTFLVFGATYPVWWRPSSEPLVVRFPRTSSTAAWTNCQRSFLGPTSQLRLIGRLGVFLSLAFRLDHVCSAQQPASGPSVLALSALCQVPSSFNSTPGHPKFLARHWR